MSAITVSDSLLQAAKNYLDLTWDDAQMDAKLSGSIRRGIAFIQDKTGIMEIEGNDRAEELLFCYLLYDRAGALDTFKKNYQSDINGLRMKTEVDRYEQQTTTASGDIS